ncbi:MAG: 30S ribosomal protein S13 [Fimbriimonadales bacterium]|jgi:small subunit ribosomal protein S13|nr:MAG: 30S ribosomal protein S13 [Fimbriimonadales bacterium]GIV11640.1 MAG: 30S ribosomal protein S13 [Fimbriimonadales bacterium]GIV11666.1 MAG: 30S ribosomal protein S13 [Fimbriimonadales bacterium]
MARIAGVDLPRDRKVEYALPVIFGVGLPSARKILAATGIDPNKRVRDLTEEEVAKLRAEIETNYTIEGDLRREQQMNIRRLIEIGCYRGIRHRRGLPVHGQRTRTNARTRKGPKKTVSTGKKKKAK